MMLWIIFAVMTVAAVFAVLWPLGRKPAVVHGGSDRLVYQDQLQEVDRDRAAGLIGDAEAESARVEISRRLLAAADAKAPEPLTPLQMRGWRRAAAIAGIVVVPVVALGFYLKLGSPDVPDQSAFVRLNASSDHQSIASLIGQVEAHLAANPNDGAGWEVIAPVYSRMGRFDDAVGAWRKAIALKGDSPGRESGLGEALVGAADGVVTDAAKQAFQKAIAGDPQDAKAGYFLGLADEQDGNATAAAAKWQALLAQAPPDAPWADFVRQALARVSPTQAADSGPAKNDIAAADSMSDAQRAQMVSGMVQRLADRLHANGADVEGWLRLVRSYVVLGDRDKARDAAADAKRALSDHPDEIKRIDDLVKDLGLAG